jgi:hypothetical protein
VTTSWHQHPVALLGTVSTPLVGRRWCDDGHDGRQMKRVQGQGFIDTIESLCTSVPTSRKFRSPVTLSRSDGRRSWSAILGECNFRGVITWMHLKEGGVEDELSTQAPVVEL